jgi:hypothetical protein
MGALGSALAAGIDTYGSTYVFWKGTDANLWEAYWDGEKWVGPFNLDEGQLGSQPAVTVYG